MALNEIVGGMDNSNGSEVVAGLVLILLLGGMAYQAFNYDITYDEKDE